MSTQISGLTPGSTAVPAPRSPRRTLYRGDPGMWSWVLHRITGATIFFFLFVHVLDTALVRVSPQAYNEVIETYKSPI
ncbi:MAG TPA: succinate dehydrogenase, cytochrome b556 subunit, partial [Mycobacterium sp.]|nr:succinate dehydrogenase, cytochrome b556 subunit [Mycobacterium sp.]